MGTYLATGIVTKIELEKTSKSNLSNIEEALRKELNLDHYVFNESEDSPLWTIKPDLFKGNFVEFMETQFQMYGLREKNFRETIEQIKSNPDLIKLAQQRSLANYQSLGILSYVKVLNNNGFENYVDVGYEMIAFFMDGKILMECYANIFHYFEKTIRLQEEKYPIASCVKVMITN